MGVRGDEGARPRPNGSARALMDGTSNNPTPSQEVYGQEMAHLSARPTTFVCDWGV